MILYALISALCLFENILIIYAVRWYFVLGFGYAVKIDDNNNLKFPNILEISLFRRRRRTFIRKITFKSTRIVPVFHFSITNGEARKGEIWFMWWIGFLPVVAFRDWELALGVFVLAAFSALVQFNDAPRIFAEALRDEHEAA